MEEENLEKYYENKLEEQSNSLIKRYEKAMKIGEDSDYKEDIYKKEFLDEIENELYKIQGNQNNDNKSHILQKLAKTFFANIENYKNNPITNSLKNDVYQARSDFYNGNKHDYYEGEFNLVQRYKTDGKLLELFATIKVYQDFLSSNLKRESENQTDKKINQSSNKEVLVQSTHVRAVLLLNILLEEFGIDFKSHSRSKTILYDFLIRKPVYTLKDSTSSSQYNYFNKESVKSPKNSIKDLEAVKKIFKQFNEEEVSKDFKNIMKRIEDRIEKEKNAIKD